MCLELGTGQISHTQRRSVDLLGSDGFQLPYSLLSHESNASQMSPVDWPGKLTAASQHRRRRWEKKEKNERTEDANQTWSVLT